jgi:hypothetical protein
MRELEREILIKLRFLVGNFLLHVAVDWLKLHLEELLGRRRTPFPSLIWQQKGMHLDIFLL